MVDERVYISAIGVEVENVRVRSWTVPAGYCASAGVSVGSCGKSFSLISSTLLSSSDSKEGSRGESVRSSTLGGEGWTKDVVDSPVSLRGTEGAEPKRRDKLGLLGSKGDFFGLSTRGADRGVSVVCLDTGVVEREISSIEAIVTGLSPKSIRPLAVSIPDTGGGDEKSSSRRSRSSVRTPPGILREGPRDSISAFRVIRFVLE